MANLGLYLSLQDHLRCIETQWSARAKRKRRCGGTRRWQKARRNGEPVCGTMREMTDAGGGSEVERQQKARIAAATTESVRNLERLSSHRLAATAQRVAVRDATSQSIRTGGTNAVINVIVRVANSAQLRLVIPQP
jgi:hypothetical protein